MNYTYAQIEMLKNHRKPNKVCQYGENCFRKNPIHFIEFSHDHLDEIYAKGIDNETNQYNIPNELLKSKDLIEIQLKLLEKIFSHKNDTEQIETKIPSQYLQKNNVKKTNETPGKLQTSNNFVKNHNTEIKSPNNKSSTVGYHRKSINEPKTNNTHKRSAPSCSFGGQQNDSNNSILSKKQKLSKQISDYIPVVLPKGQMAQKLENAAPYNFFLTAITSAKSTHIEPLTVTLQEILDKSLGEIECSVQINFMIDIGWLLGHYYFAGCLEASTLVLYGDETNDLKTISKTKPQITAVKINMTSPFATHHTKMMLFGYKDGSMRVVISTANLYEDDWHNRTQGVWISPKLCEIKDNADTSFGESETGFRHDLMLYLTQYKVAHLQPWIARIRKTNFSAINVFLIASTPGGFQESSTRGFIWGHPRLGGLLKKYSVKIEENVPIVAQSSSIGSLGTSIQTWIQSDFLNSLRKDEAVVGIRQFPQFKMIYPSVNNVKNSHDGMLGGGCLPYSKNINDKQLWLKQHLYQWKAKIRNRDQAMPHIKTYGRWAQKELYWFVLTSANLSKAAWGAFNKTSKLSPTLRIMNYEVGVLFLPKFVTGGKSFPLHYMKDGIPPFPLPYDNPLKPYGVLDTPFLMNYLQN